MVQNKVRCNQEDSNIFQNHIVECNIQVNYNAEVRPYNSISSGRMKFGVVDRPWNESRRPWCWPKACLGWDSGGCISRCGCEICSLVWKMCSPQMTMNASHGDFWLLPWDSWCHGDGSLVVNKWYGNNGMKWTNTFPVTLPLLTNKSDLR